MLEEYPTKVAERADEALKLPSAKQTRPSNLPNALRELRRRGHTPGHTNALAESRQASELDAVLRELYPSSAERAKVDPTLYHRFVWSALHQ